MEDERKKERSEKENTGNELSFTLPYLLFILLQNFTRTRSNVHTPVEHRGTKKNNDQQKKKKKLKYFSSKKRHK